MSCCPSRDAPPAPPPSAPRASGPSASGPSVSRLIPLRGGKFTMGTRDVVFAQDGEGPARAVRIKPFSISATTVTNAEFDAFVTATGYVTEAEHFGWSYVFHAHLKDAGAHQPLPGLEWWRKVDGSAWHRPEGPGSDWKDRADHPAVHVSHRDATAYATWAGARLPSEAEWEYAAAAGNSGQRFAWGAAEPNDTDCQPCNIWQGRFPDLDTGKDGHTGTAPARSFAPNGFGLYNMCGNVWEWTSDRFRVRSLKKAARQHTETAPRYVIKGGSFLCHISYCYRYRIAARSGNTPDSTTSHTGFRIVRSA